MADHVDWSPLHPFGAKVDLALSGEVTEAQIAALRGLFDERRLLLFPGQRLSFEEQSRISGWFGPVTAKAAPTRLANDPKVGGLVDAELAYHSDLSCAPEPLLGISLFAIDVAEDAAPTHFVDAMSPVAALPDALRARLGELQVMNLWPIRLAERQRSADAPKDWPGTAHPVLKAHPRTGAPIIYVNGSHTDRILGAPLDEGESLIQELFARLYDDGNRYEHHWRTGDFIVWDNLALQHARPRSAPGVTRTLQRVEIGSASYMEQMPPQLLAAYAGA